METKNNEKVIKELERENLELKLTAIKSDLENFKHEIQAKLNLILEQTSKTNGSVARVIKEIEDIKIANIERDRVQNELQEYKKGTSFWYLLQNNKWIVIVSLLAASALTIVDVRELILKLFIK